MRKLRIAALAIAGALLTMPAMAQTWPDHPIKMVVPFPAGGPADALGRLFTHKLSTMLGQQVVVETRGGAGGNIGAQAVAKAAPDGYTMLLHSSSQTVNPLMYDNPGYDPFKDFAPISAIADYKLVVVVHKSVPINSFKELIETAKAKPGSITYASSGGAGAPTHLSVEMFKQQAGLDLVHVPYAGAAPATNDLVAGHVMMMFNNPLSVLPHIRSGTLRALAYTGLQRLPQLPDAPTVAESGFPGFNVGTWYGVWAPAGTPAAIVQKTGEALVAIANMDDVKEQLAAQGLSPIGLGPEAFAKFQRDESARWGKVIKAANIHIQ
jgi:tripartite-type tricarboxylate transporter receptor subunit TctC